MFKFLLQPTEFFAFLSSNFHWNKLLIQYVIVLCWKQKLLIFNVVSCISSNSKWKTFQLASNNEFSTNWNMAESCNSKDFCDYTEIQSKAILFKIHGNDKYSFFYLKLNDAMHFSSIINISANGNGKCVIRKNKLILKFFYVHLRWCSLP